ncbi:hypothetical protein BD413DRAFT_507990 [Trametes elegans]|nr:hypothetical protein BD413DRAFT_507990 [Trametes elegans]
MSWLAPVTLAFLHALYRLVLVFKYIFRSREEPRPIAAERSKVPQHLAFILVPNPEAGDEDNEQYMLNSVEKVAGWCRMAGISRLTVYDREGVLAKCSLELRERLLAPSKSEEVEESPVECDIRYPLTPPPSDDAESRPLSPHSGISIPKLSVTTIRYPSNTSKPKRRASIGRAAIKRRRAPQHSQKPQEPLLTVYIASYQSSKSAIAAAASAFLQDIRRNGNGRSAPAKPSLPSIQELNAVLEGEHGFPSPELMIVHRRPRVGQLRSPAELWGFPPWQTRLTEIHWERYAPTAPFWRTSRSSEISSSLDETEFRRALDEYDSAEMRVGT